MTRWPVTRWIVPVALLALVGLLAYGLLQPAKDPPSVLTPGKPAPTFALQDTAGKLHDLSAYKQAGKPVVVNFWASWCVPCHQEAAALAQASREASNVQFLGVLYNDKTGKDREFVQRYGVPYPTVLDPSSATAIRYGIGKIPDTFIVDAQGNIAYHHLGAVTDSTALLAEFRAALNKVSQ